MAQARWKELWRIDSGHSGAGGPVTAPGAFLDDGSRIGAEPGKGALIRQADKAGVGMSGFMYGITAVEAADTIFPRKFVFLALGTECCFSNIGPTLEGILSGCGRMAALL